MASRSELTGGTAGIPDTSACDREPIHIPGAVQPHGVLLVSDPTTLEVVAGAGDVEGVLAADWLGRALGDLLQQDIAGLVRGAVAGPGGTVAAAAVAGHDVALHRAGAYLLAELEPADPAPRTGAETLAWLDAIAAGFERAANLQTLCERATRAFRTLTGFDRVMLYRFLDDDAGRVVAEDRAEGLGTFLHHHFPATDIPRQARALYVRNRTRVIPDATYTPALLRPAGFEALDLSDVAIRSVSPIHVRYLANMGVAASASISIVQDGVLWGLIACHNETPRLLSREVRAAAGALAGGLARQIRAKEEAERYRERLALRSEEDALRPWLMGEERFDQLIAERGDELRRTLDADGLALVTAKRVERAGTFGQADAATLRLLADLVRTRERDGEGGGGGGGVFATCEIAAEVPGFDGTGGVAGVLGFRLPEAKATLLWLRAEQVEEIEWAGNPHAKAAGSAGELTPRTSFGTWREAVRGRSRRWTLEEVEAAHRLRRAIREARAANELRRLNRELERAVTEKDAALRQKDLMAREVDHRVQNSLQLVASFLSLQAKNATPAAAAELTEARARLAAVAQVHRRLYRDDQVGTINLARYLEELIGDLKASLGAAWAGGITSDLAPVLVATDRAVNVGLVAVELVINATKYAYPAGTAGRIDIALEQHRNKLRLIVADHGVGMAAGSAPRGDGFGGRMMQAVVARLDGTLEQGDNAPGLRAVLTAPVQD